MALRRYIYVSVLLIFILSIMSVSATNIAGTAQDPIATVSYIKNEFVPAVTNYLDSKISGVLTQKASTVETALQNAVKGKDLYADKNRITKTIAYTTYMSMLDGGYYTSTDGAQLVKINKNERLVVGQYSSFTPSVGKVLIGGDATSEVVNVSAGARSLVNTAASIQNRYVVAGEGLISLYAADGPAEVYVEGTYQKVPVFMPQNTGTAFELKKIQLFRGSNLGFELERSATRLEGLILFIRLIGEEEAAMDFTGKHPYTDVPLWANDEANKYVAYAHSKGYTKGVSETLFGTRNPITAEQYMTFVLRALGYSDTTDFKWEESVNKSVQLGILDPEDKNMIHRRGFYRDLVVYVSGNSLLATKKGTATQLITTLVQKGVISEDQARSFRAHYS